MVGAGCPELTERVVVNRSVRTTEVDTIIAGFSENIIRHGSVASVDKYVLVAGFGHDRLIAVELQILDGDVRSHPLNPYHFGQRGIRTPQRGRIFAGLYGAFHRGVRPFDDQGLARNRVGRGRTAQGTNQGSAGGLVQAHLQIFEIVDNHARGLLRG